MSLEGVAAVSQAGEVGLRQDGLAQGGDELAQEPPQLGSGQAAAERGESPSSSISGSSKRIIKR